MITLIIPFFNEENELPDLVKDLDKFEEQKKKNYFRVYFYK